MNEPLQLPGPSTLHSPLHFLHLGDEESRCISATNVRTYSPKPITGQKQKFISIAKRDSLNFWSANNSRFLQNQVSDRSGDLHDSIDLIKARYI